MVKLKVDTTALFVAIIALGLSIWQGRAQIIHNHVSVEPRINSYFSSNKKDEQHGIYIINNGMGTAFVSKLDVYVDGQIVQNHEYGKFYSAVLKLKLNPFCFIVGNPRPNDSFKVGEEQFLIEARKKDLLSPKKCPKEHGLLMEYQKNRLDYKLEFESIYGDRFKYSYAENIQIEI